MFTVLSAWRKSFEQFTRFILNAAATIKRLATLTQLIGVSCYSLHQLSQKRGHSLTVPRRVESRVYLYTVQ